MCKEDIRIARAATPKTPKNGTAGDTALCTLPANINRYSVSVGIGIGDPTLEDPQIVVSSKIGNLVYPLAILNKHNQTCILNLMEYGSVICGQIFITDIGTDPLNIWYIGETSFDTELEKI